MVTETPYKCYPILFCSKKRYQSRFLATVQSWLHGVRIYEKYINNFLLCDACTGGFVTQYYNKIYHQKFLYMSSLNRNSEIRLIKSQLVSFSCAPDWNFTPCNFCKSLRSLKFENDLCEIFASIFLPDW